jgi:hypothetical protein
MFPAISGIFPPRNEVVDLQRALWDEITPSPALPRPCCVSPFLVSLF